ncbi:hypothetical protein C0989_011591 [Termitomyces sp. Mn162]|nr:hypothetical protein C0989_011591 [Termitomyces sp. Mn162]
MGPWKEVDTTTIWNCCEKSGILPQELLNSPSNEPAGILSVPISLLLNAKSVKSIDTFNIKVEQALSHLEKLGVFQHANHMAINELLNPVNEDKMYDDETEQEIKNNIYEAVAECWEAEQNREMNGGDVLDDEEPINEKPS